MSLMLRIRAWLDERMDLSDIKRSLLDREVPRHLTWWHTLGSATLTVFFVQMVTGAVLAIYYSPSPDHAYESVRYLTNEVTGGLLLRAIHRWAASAMVVLAVLHMVRVFVMGAYKYPREANWLVGVALFVIVMGFGFTGYLLPWDQKAYWATQVGTNMAGTTPGIGGMLAVLLRGGTQLGAATLTRFFAFHVIWLPLLLVGVVSMHLMLIIRQGIAARAHTLEEGAPPTTSAPTYPSFYREAYAASKGHGVRFWPDILGKDAIVSTVVVASIVFAAVWFGADLEAPADPTDTSYIPRPEWYFLPLFQLLKLVPGSMESMIVVGAPTAVLLALVALPFIDRSSTRRIIRRPIGVASLVIVLGGSGLLMGAALRERGPPVPVEVGRPLTSMERAGRALYRSQHCNECHAIADDGGSLGPDLTEVGLRHSAGWLHSYLETPERFRHLEDEYMPIRMPSYGLPVLTHQEVEELSRYLTSLRGNAGPDVQPALRDTFPEVNR